MFKRLLPILALLLTPCMGAQTLFLQPHTTAITVPQGTTKVLTARIEGVNDKGVTWSTTGGTLVDGLNTTSHVCTANGPCREGLYSATTGGPYTVTATSHANGAVLATQQITFGASPTKITGAGATGHPRFILTPSTVAAVVAKATAGNPMYQGMRTRAIHNFDTGGSGIPANNVEWNWSCGGGPNNTRTGLPISDQSQNVPELQAFMYAQLAVVDPSDATYNWNCYATDMFRYAMNRMIDGTLVISHGNEWSQEVDSLVYTPDLLMYTGGLSTTADLNLTRQWVAYLFQTELNLGANGNVPPYNNTNNHYQLDQNNTYPYIISTQRGQGNNYTESRMLIMTLSLLFDDTTSDDPPIAGGTLLGVANSNLNTPTGTSYSVGDTVHVGTGGGVIQVDSVIGGAPYMMHIVTPSTGYDNASNPLATTAITGSGTGLTVNINAGNTCSATRYQMCSDFSADSMHAYIYWFSGSLLLKWWSHADDPTIVANTYTSTYGTTAFPATPPLCRWVDPTIFYSCYGDGVGGESSEGSGYWSHVWATIAAMAVLHSTGYDDPSPPNPANPPAGGLGPQMSLEYSSFWDEELMSQQLFWTFFGANGQPTVPGYTFLQTGDTEVVGYVTNPSYQLWATSLMELDQVTGRTDRTSPALWSVLDSAWGGPLGTSGGCSSSQCGYVAELTTDIAGQTAWPMMITQPAADPTVSLPSDPRGNYPTDTWNDSYNHHQHVCNGFGSTNACVDTFNENVAMDHEHAYWGSFDVYQNSEYLTKGRGEYDNYNNNMSASQFRNTVSIMNTNGTHFVTCAGGHVLGFAIQYGGQFGEDAEMQGLPAAPLHSELPGYIANSGVSTLAYNGCNVGTGADYTDVTGSSQDFIWIRGANQIVRYARAATGASADKSNWINSTGAVTVSGNHASWLTRSSTQKANFTTLLPVSVSPVAIPLINETVMTGPFSVLQQGTSMQLTCVSTYADGTTGNNVASNPALSAWISYDPSILTVSSTGLVTAVGSVGQDTVILCGSGVDAGVDIIIEPTSSAPFSVDSGADQLADWEPYQQIRVDAGNVTNTQFLSTFEWGASSFTPATTTLVQSSAGQGYDCAKISTAMGCFMRSLATFTGTTVAASGATTQYFANLTPNTNYTITGAGTPGSANSDSAGVLTFAATGTGNIVVSPGSGPTAPPFNLTGTIFIKGSAQFP